MDANRHMSNVSIIIEECMTFRDDLLVVKNNEFLNLEIEGDLKVVMDDYNKKKSNIPNFIILLMEDIWRITQDLNIICCHIYSKANRIIYYLVKKK